MDKAQFNNMALGELKELKEYLDGLVDRKEEQARKQAKEELEKRAKELGFEADDLFGGKPARKATHRNPENPKQTWAAGSPGQKPGWLQKHLKNGGKLDDVKIKE